MGCGASVMKEARRASAMEQARSASAMEEARSTSAMQEARCASAMQEARSASTMARIYLSHQQTETAQKERSAWIKGQVQSIKASMPNFNKGIPLPGIADSFNTPVYGLKISHAVMQCFASPNVTALAERLRIRIPKCMVSSFVQGKMGNVRIMIDEAVKRDDCKGRNQEAIEKLKDFLDEFVRKNSSDVPDLQSWMDFVNNYALVGWENRLSFSQVLQNFGCEDEFAHSLAQHVHTDIDPENGNQWSCSLEQLSLRWLSKAMTAYAPVGCLTDVVNLVFAMEGDPPKDVPCEDDIKNKILEFSRRIEEHEFDGLWIPTHFVMDAESDDTLAWLILEYIRQNLGTELEVLVQLPTDEKLNGVAKDLQDADTFKNVTVFRDKDSKNAKAVMNNFQILM